MKEIRCYGCGAILQSENVNEIGYVPKISLEKDHILCKRCFRMKNYHELQSTPLTKDDFLNILQYIGEQDCLVVYLIDLFDFNGSIIQGFMRHISNNDVLLLANKRDLLPKSLKDRRLKQWVQRQLKKENIKPKDVIITSAKTNYQYDEIFAAIDEYRNGRDVYVVGVTNVGKSSFINGLLKHYTNDHEHLITTSEFPGTTLDLIEIPFDEKSSLYDTPGIINEDQFAHQLPTDLLKKVLPQSEIKPVNLPLKQGNSVYMSGIARFDFIEGKDQNVIFYFSKNIEIHRTKLENADRIYNNHKTFKIELADIKTIDMMKTIRFNIKEKSDIVISGLGFIKVEGPMILDIHVPEHVSVFVRETLV